MTTIDAAAAWRSLKLVTFAAFAALVGISLSGCGTTTSIFSTADSGQGSTLVDQTTPTAAATTSNAQRVAIAPVIGAPDVIAKHLRSELTQALAKNSIAVAPADAAAGTAAYTLRGYVVSARVKTNTKISYIWDVTDAAGKRVNRITGEEVAPASSSGDPWAAMTPRIVQAISAKTASSMATWLPTQLKAAQAPAAIANATTGQAANAAGAATRKAASGLQPAGSAAAAPTGTTTTGSIKKAGAVTAIVPAVTGAPGDGGVSLTNAIRKQLSRNGISMASAATAATYQVVGRVKLGAGKAGKQPIRIDWDVHDPAGKKLGTVSQNNDIPAGSLNGAWGKTADAAAAAATQGILKLLPGQTTSTN